MSQAFAPVRRPRLLAVVMAWTLLLAVSGVGAMAHLEDRVRDAAALAMAPASQAEQALRASTVATLAYGDAGEIWLLTAKECASCRDVEVRVARHAARHAMQAHFVAVADLSSQASMALTSASACVLPAGGAKRAACAAGPDSSALREALGGLNPRIPALIWRTPEGLQVGDAQDPRVLRGLTAAGDAI